MENLTVHVTLKSDALIGSGEGFGAIIDSDIVFDPYGVPFIPAKRFKGCLRDSACDVEEMYQKADAASPVQVDETFGGKGQVHSTDIFFTDLRIPDYEENSAWLDYLFSEFKLVISTDAVTSAFTYRRQSTRINVETGIAEDHSLRTVRVIKKGYTFIGEIKINSDRVETLTLACLNLRRVGTKRNRGLGEVEVSLFKGKEKLQIPERLKT